MACYRAASRARHASPLPSPAPAPPSTPAPTEMRDRIYEYVYLGSAPKRLENHIADERGHNGNRGIGGRRNVRDSPGKAHFPSFSRAGEFAHKKVGIEQEDYKADFDRRSPDCFLHNPKSSRPARLRPPNQKESHASVNSILISSLRLPYAAPTTLDVWRRTCEPGAG